MSEKLDNDFKAVQKARAAEKLSLLRLVRSAVKNLEIAKGAAASDEDIIALIQREIKQHRETIVGFAAAGRTDDIDRQEAEIAWLQAYLPPALTDVELKELVEQAIADTGAQGPGDIGKVMGAVMPQVRGRAAGDTVGQIVRELLAGKNK